MKLRAGHLIFGQGRSVDQRQALRRVGIAGLEFGEGGIVGGGGPHREVGRFGGGFLEKSGRGPVGLGVVFRLT